MVCALTVRKLKPGSFDEFRQAFMGDGGPEDAPSKLVRFNMIRNVDDPDEVISFGFFDGSAEELREMAGEGGYDEQMEKVAPFVESVGADGMFEVVEHMER